MTDYQLNGMSEEPEVTRIELSDITIEFDRYGTLVIKQSMRLVESQTVQDSVIVVTKGIVDDFVNGICDAVGVM